MFVFLFHCDIQDATDRVRDHDFLIRMHDADSDRRLFPGNHSLVCSVALFIEFNAKKSQAITDPGADGGRVLSDATREYQCVESTQRRREGADPFLDLVAKQRDRRCLICCRYRVRKVVRRVDVPFERNMASGSPILSITLTNTCPSTPPVSNSATLILDEPPLIVRMCGSAGSFMGAFVQRVIAATGYERLPAAPPRHRAAV
jgi:hypothetical protein